MKPGHAFFELGLDADALVALAASWRVADAIPFPTEVEDRDVRRALGISGTSDQVKPPLAPAWEQMALVMAVELVTPAALAEREHSVVPVASLQVGLPILRSERG